MIKVTGKSIRNHRRGAYTRVATRLLLALASVGMAMPVMAQQLVPTGALATPEKLCTADSNTTYGWYELGTGFLGIKVPGGLTGCAWFTELKVDLGGLTLPLVDEVVYDLAIVPPLALPSVTLPLLEPALCENYYTGSAGTNTSWVMMLEDANGASTISPVNGVETLEYTVANGVLTPRLANTDLAWLRCHSALGKYEELVSTTPDPGEIFQDGFESAVDLRIEFFDVNTGDPLDNDIIVQSSVPGSTVTYKVRVTNLGNVQAQDVRVREFVPTNAALLSPTVSYGPCIDHAPNGDAPCTIGGADRLSVDIGNLAPGVANAREFTVTRGSSSTDASPNQTMALIQVAAFSKPSTSVEANLADNSRSLRIQVADEVHVTRAATVGGTVIRTSVPPVCGNEVNGVTTCQPGATGLQYSASAVSGYAFNGFSGCPGTPSDNPVLPTGGSFTTSAINTDCILTADFRANLTVTASAPGGHGSATPSSQSVQYNQPATLTLTPATGYKASASGCGGLTQVGATNTWTTAPVTANCSVVATFDGIISIVTATAGPHGYIDDAAMKAVTYPNQTTSFKVAADDVIYRIDEIPGGNCPSGFWVGNEYFISGILGDCTVEFTFSLIEYEVTTDANISDGYISVDDDGMVTHGGFAHFTLVPVPSNGYHVVPGSVVGTPECNDVVVDLNTNTGTAGPITEDGCVLTAQFAINEYQVVVELKDGHEDDGYIACHTLYPVGAGGRCVEELDDNEQFVKRVVISGFVYNDNEKAYITVLSNNAGYVAWTNGSGCMFNPAPPPSTDPTEFISTPINTGDCSITVGFSLDRAASR